MKRKFSRRREYLSLFACLNKTITKNQFLKSLSNVSPLKFGSPGQGKCLRAGYEENDMATFGE